MVRHLSWPSAAAALVIVGACGGPVPAQKTDPASAEGLSATATPQTTREPMRQRPRREPSQRESERLSRLLESAKYEDATFEWDERRLGPGEAVSRWKRAASQAGPVSAEVFIREIAGRSPESGRRIRVHLPNGDTVSATSFLSRLLDRQEGRIPAAQASPEAEPATVLANGGGATTSATSTTAQAASHAGAVADLLERVERSPLSFVAPARKGPPKLYSGPEFAAMLRKKQRWIGRDGVTFETFLSEVAAHSYMSLHPYCVRLPDGTEVPFRRWALGADPSTPPTVDAAPGSPTVDHASVPSQSRTIGPERDLPIREPALNVASP